MAYLLDTNVLTDFVANVGQVAHRLKETNPADVFISSLTIMEIDCALLLDPGKPGPIKGILRDIFNTATVLPFGEEEAKIAGNLLAQFKLHGSAMDAPRLFIAATAVANDLTLVTSNTAEMSRISDLSLVDWRTE